MDEAQAQEAAIEVAPARRGIKKGLYLIPSAFTAANLGMGFFAVMAVLRGFQSMSGTAPDLERAAVLFDSAAIAIGWAFLFDSLDGRIARLTKTTTEIGVQFDSIADVLTFGIAPAVLVYAWGYGSALAEGTDQHKLGWFLSFMYLMCGAFRLARFNVQATRPRVLAEGTVKLDKNYFVGLPIPAAACLIAALIHFSPQPLVSREPWKAELYSVLMMVLVALLGMLMVSTIRYTSFKSVGVSRRSTRLMILAVASIGMLIYLYSRYVLLALVSAYVLHGPLLRLGVLFRRRQQPVMSNES
jgi:CDP-diacylglycerol--serine O-phosphatidyltransferase